MEPALDSFLKAVLRSGLLPREELLAIGRGLPRDQRDDPKSLAEHLVRTGKLTRFQAKKLLAGRALGLLLGPFQVLSPIGKGGMGTVYLARDQRSGQLMALKVLPPKRAREEERMLARFRREMELSQRVAHPNLAYTFDAGVHQGVYYIAMEYIPGKSLHRLVADEGPLQVPRAARLFAEVAAGLDHAHGQGLIHRDLKPSNVMVTPKDHAKVLDLGLALMAGEAGGDREVIGGRGYIVGSMDYIAPEQTQDAAAVDARSDLYALGCTLFFALMGRPPFPGGTSREKIQRHRSEDPPRLTQLRPSVPQGFAEIVHRLMEKSPAQRYASAAEVRDALTPWQSGDAALPMDRADDSAYEMAVLELQQAEVPTDFIAEDIPVEPPESADPPPDNRDMVWLVGGLIGFWVILLVVVAAIWLFR